MAQHKLKSINLNLGRLLKEKGLCKSIYINPAKDEKTLIDIVEPKVLIYATIHLDTNRCLPLKLKIWHRRSETNEFYFRKLPDDLSFYISMNNQEPGPHSYDAKFCEHDLATYNNFGNGETQITFGKEKDREAA